MAGFQVVWARAATVDLEEIVAYVAFDSPSAAGALIEKMEIRARTLEEYPQRGRVVPELARFHIRSYREIIVHPYRLLYRIEKKIVDVIGVFDGRRDLSEIILLRLLRET